MDFTGQGTAVEIFPVKFHNGARRGWRLGSQKFYQQKFVFEQNLAKLRNIYPSQLQGYNITRYFFNWLCLQTSDHELLLVVKGEGISKGQKELHCTSLENSES